MALRQRALPIGILAPDEVWGVTFASLSIRREMHHADYDGDVGLGTKRDKYRLLSIFAQVAPHPQL